MAFDALAKEGIDEWNREDMKASTFMTLYQTVSNLIYPMENQIQTKKTPGQDLSLDITDPTAMMDSQDMAAGLSSSIIPSGQQFCSLTAKDRRLNNIERIRGYLSRATEILHDEIYASNFMLQFNESLRALVVFGTCNLYSEWDYENRQLNYKDWGVSSYRFKQDNHGNVDTVLLKCGYTARQAFQEFGMDAGPKAIASASSTEKESEKFDYLYWVRPHRGRNPLLSDNKNYKYEFIVINMSEGISIPMSGFQQLPFHVARWMKSSVEKYGRGQGTVIISTVKELQKIRADYLDWVNMAVNPPREVLDNFEGQLKIMPGAINRCSQLNSSRPMEFGSDQAFQGVERQIAMKQEEVHKAFYVKAISPLDDLPGDRRTTVEIIERVKQGYKRLVLPILRLYAELLTPVTERSVFLLIENGRIPHPKYEAPELMKNGFGIEYMGEMALALRDKQARGFQQFAQFAALMNQAFPGINQPSDNINPDRATRRMGRAFGINEDDFTTEEERQAIRQQRQQEVQQQKAAMATQVASAAYKDTSAKAEEGSPAESAMAEMGG